MNGRLLAKQGFENEQRFFMNQIENERLVKSAHISRAGEHAQPQWAITSYLELAKNRRMSRLRTLFSQLVPTTRMS